MPAELRHFPEHAVVVGWDFSTGSVKALAFDLAGQVLAEERLPTDLWTEGGVAELSLTQLEGQAHAVTRGLAAKLAAAGRLTDWLVGGVSATHHTAGRVDEAGVPVRRAICWNDQTLARHHAEGLARLGGQDVARQLTGGPWAVRYSLSHLVKDETNINSADWARTRWMLPHGPLAAGYLTGVFGVTSVSSAASTGLLDLRTNQWADGMLAALADPEHRHQARAALPRVLAADEPVGPVSEALAHGAKLPPGVRPLVFPTLDDQAAGLVGGGAVDPGQLAIILGNSAVVNSSAAAIPAATNLDVMRLNWGPYLLMRCYSNGAQFLDPIVGERPDWAELERLARALPPGAGGVRVTPFRLSEPSLGVHSPAVRWTPAEPAGLGQKVRAAFESLAYLIALAVEEHEATGEPITKVSVSGGIARSELMVEILASVLNRPLERLQSAEGPALGAAAAALAGFESHLRRRAGHAEPYTVADAVAQMVKYRTAATPNPAWVAPYAAGLADFRRDLTAVTQA